MATFKMPTGKELDKMLKSLSEKDKKEIMRQFEKDVARENEMRKINERRFTQKYVDQQR